MEQELTPQPSPELTPEEREIIEYLEKVIDRKLSQQEVNLALAQARAIGDL